LADDGGSVRFADGELIDLDVPDSRNTIDLLALNWLRPLMDEDK
jgi:hypothetical protein